MMSLLLLSTLIILGQNLFSQSVDIKPQVNNEIKIQEELNKDEDAIVMIKGQEVNNKIYDLSRWGKNEENRFMVQSTQGTGFVVSKDGKILTNKHVVGNQEATYTVVTTKGLEYKITSIVRDSDNDIAVVTINPYQHWGQELETVSLGDSNKIKNGEEIVAMSNDPGEYEPTVQSGKITKLGTTIIAGDSRSRKAERLNDVIETDLGLIPGNSGSPLFNSQGEVIGINTATSTGEEKASFALPINPAKDLLETIEE